MHNADTYFPIHNAIYQHNVHYRYTHRIIQILIRLRCCHNEPQNALRWPQEVTAGTVALKLIFKTGAEVNLLHIAASQYFQGEK